jgi:hypothetical protein
LPAEALAKEGKDSGNEAAPGSGFQPCRRVLKKKNFVF